MKVFEILEQEHDRILEMLDVLDAVRDALDRQIAVPEDELKNIVRFFRRYADACHHAKEENTLFPALEAAGLPREGGPIGVMLHEHVEGRKLVSAMAGAAEEAGDSAPARDAFSRAAHEFGTLLRNHIHKENEILFQIGRRVLDAAKEPTLLEDYAAYESREVPASEKEALLEMLADLRARHVKG